MRSAPLVRRRNGRAAPEEPPPPGSNGEQPPPAQETVRQQPHDLEAERSLLAGLLMLQADRDASQAAEMMALVRNCVAAADFYREPYSRAFEAICKIEERGDPIDRVLVKEEIERNGKFTPDAVETLFDDLDKVIPTVGVLTRYAERISALAKSRQLIETVRAIERGVFAHPG